MSDTLCKTSNDAVIVKLTQILNYIRTGTKKKKTKKLDYDLDQAEAGISVEVKTEKAVDDFKIFSDEDEVKIVINRSLKIFKEMPKSDDDSKIKNKKSSRRRSRSRSRDRRDRRDRKRSRSRDRAKRSSKDKRRRRSRSRSNSPVESSKPKYFDDLEKDEKVRFE